MYLYKKSIHKKVFLKKKNFEIEDSLYIRLEYLFK